MTSLGCLEKQLKSKSNMIHIELNGTLGECLSRLDEWLSLKDLKKKVHIIIDIQDDEIKKKV